VYRSNVATASLNPYWEQDVVSLETLCNYDLEREIQVSIWDTPSRVLLGWCSTTVLGLIGAVSEDGSASKALDICKPSDYGNLLHMTTRLGKLVVLHASVSTQQTNMAVTGTERQESLSNLPQAVAVEILTPPPMRRDYTFNDYTENGRCTLELCVAVDFTRANGASCSVLVLLARHSVIVTVNLQHSTSSMYIDR
jgi:hypothetical protein